MWRIWMPLAGLLFATSVQGAELPCPVPDDLALHDLVLPAVKRSVAEGALPVLVLGGAAMAGAAAGDASATLPARLETDLAAALPGVRVRVVNKAVPRATADAALPRIPKLIAETGARLVIWATGAREAATGGDLEPFVSALEDGIAAARAAGADVILVDMQYAPSLALIANYEPFRTALIDIAAVHEIPILLRYEMMRAWNDGGILDLDVREPEARRQVARRLYACLAAALAGPIAAAAR